MSWKKSLWCPGRKVQTHKRPCEEYLARWYFYRSSYLFTGKEYRKMSWMILFKHLLWLSSFLGFVRLLLEERGGMLKWTSLVLCLLGMVFLNSSGAMSLFLDENEIRQALVSPASHIYMCKAKCCKNMAMMSLLLVYTYMWKGCTKPVKATGSNSYTRIQNRAHSWTDDGQFESPEYNWMFWVWLLHWSGKIPICFRVTESYICHIPE